MARKTVNLSQREKAAANGSPGKYRRRPPSPEEQARREAWGHKWGKLVSEATRDIREGNR